MTRPPEFALTGRRLAHEHMDDPAIPAGELAAALRFIRLVNRRLGGVSAVLRCLEQWCAEDEHKGATAWPDRASRATGGESRATSTACRLEAGGPAVAPGDEAVLRILDVGTGSADIPLAIVRWGERTGRRVHVTAVDFHPTTLALARQHIGDCGDIELVQIDARKLTDCFRASEFHVVHAGMFLHHLPDIEVITVLAAMNKLASRGVIWNDLVRGPLEKAAVRLLTLGLPAHVRHDAIVSVGAGFTRREALDLANRAGWVKGRWRRLLSCGRFVLTTSRSD